MKGIANRQKRMVQPRVEKPRDFKEEMQKDFVDHKKLHREFRKKLIEKMQRTQKSGRKS